VVATSLFHPLHRLNGAKPSFFDSLLGYFRATAFFYDAAGQMERKLFDEDCRPIAAYNLRHDEIYKSAWSRFTTLNAPFTLIGVFFMAALVTDVAIFFFHIKVV